MVPEIGILKREAGLSKMTLKTKGDEGESQEHSGRIACAKALRWKELVKVKTEKVKRQVESL